MQAGGAARAAVHCAACALSALSYATCKIEAFRSVGLLLAALHEGLRTAQPAPLPLLAALVRLVAATPPKLLRPDTPRLLPWLLEALRRLQEDGGGGGGGSGMSDGGGGRRETLLAAAAAIQTAIQQPTGTTACCWSSDQR